MCPENTCTYSYMPHQGWSLEIQSRWEVKITKLLTGKFEAQLEIPEGREVITNQINILDGGVDLF